MGMGDPNGKSCEKCNAPAKKSFQFMRKLKGGKRGAITPTGMFLHTCGNSECIEWGERMTDEPRPALRKS